MDSIPCQAAGSIVCEIKSIIESTFDAQILNIKSDNTLTLCIDSFGPYRYNLLISDLEVGDKILVFYDNEGRIVYCKLEFDTVEYIKYLQDLILVNSGLTPQCIPLSSLEVSEVQIPPVGVIEVLHTRGALRILKYKDSIFRYQPKQVKHVPEPNPYLFLPIASTELRPPTRSDFKVISLNVLNEEFTVQHLQDSDKTLTLRMSDINTSQVPWAFEDINLEVLVYSEFNPATRSVTYELLLYPVTRIKKAGELYTLDITSVGNHHINVNEIGEFRDLIEKQQERVKVLFYQGKIKAFVYQNQIYRQIDYSLVSLSSNPKPNEIHYNLQDDEAKISFDKIDRYIAILPDKKDVLASVFSHGRILPGSKIVYLKAIAICYLEHVTRPSTSPNLLRNFISSLSSRTGAFETRIQTESDRVALISHLESLYSKRTLDELGNYLRNPDFMNIFIQELKNITICQMFLRKVHENVIKGVQTDFNKKIEVSKHLGKALNIMIFSHSLRDDNPINLAIGEFNLIINLLCLRDVICLLYYEYQDAEDNLIQIDMERFQCIDCEKLPHRAYFSRSDYKRCCKCYNSEKGKEENKDRPEFLPGNIECDGCGRSLPIAELNMFQECKHILCNHCKAISDTQRECEICKKSRLKSINSNPSHRGQHARGNNRSYRGRGTNIAHKQNERITDIHAQEDYKQSQLAGNQEETKQPQQRTDNQTNRRAKRPQRPHINRRKEANENPNNPSYQSFGSSQ